MPNEFNDAVDPQQPNVQATPEQPATSGADGGAATRPLPPLPASQPQATVPLNFPEQSAAQHGAGYSSAGYNGSVGYNGSGHNGSGGNGAGYAGAAYAAQPAPAKRQAKVGVVTLAVATLVGGLVGGGVVAGVSSLGHAKGNSVSSGQVHNDPVMVKNPDNATNITAAAQKAAPSVVTISAVGGDASGTGSGIILDKDGHILTNTHVVTLDGDVADAKIQVQLSDGKVYNAKVVGIDPTNDVAVVKIDAPNLQPATLGNSNDLNVGEPAIAIGAPLGLSNTVTDGIISTLNRTIAVQSSAVPDTKSDEGDKKGSDDFGGGGGFDFAPPEGQSPSQKQGGSQGMVYLNVIQTDAAINPGNSGGALVNDKGEVIGVNVAIASAGRGESDGGESGNIGVGFAIPINNAKRVADEIIKTGSARHGFLGATVSQAGSQGSDADSSGSSGSGDARSAFTVGAKVEEVVPDGPAAKAGLKPGDVITGVNDAPIRGNDELIATVRQNAPGSQVQIHYLRGGKESTANVTLGEQPKGQ